METWKVIPGHPNYAASNLGRIRRERPGKNTLPGRLLNTFLSGGYAQVKMDGRSQMAARLVTAAFVGPPPSPSAVVRYSDGNRLNLQADNLGWWRRPRWWPNTDWRKLNADVD